MELASASRTRAAPPWRSRRRGTRARWRVNGACVGRTRQSPSRPREVGRSVVRDVAQAVDAARRAATSASVARTPPSVRRHHARTSSTASVATELSRPTTLLLFSGSVVPAIGGDDGGSREAAAACGRFGRRPARRWNARGDDATGANAGDGGHGRHRRALLEVTVGSLRELSARADLAGSATSPKCARDEGRRRSGRERRAPPSTGRTRRRGPRRFSRDGVVPVLLPPQAPGLPPRGAAGARRHGRVRRRQAAARAARWRRPLPARAFTSRPVELAVEVCRRSVLTRALIEVWGEGDTQEELNAAVKAFPDERKDPYIAEGTTFKVCVEDFGQDRARHGEEPVVARRRAHRRPQTRPPIQGQGEDEGPRAAVLVRNRPTRQRPQGCAVGHTRERCTTDASSPPVTDRR